MSALEKETLESLLALRSEIEGRLKSGVSEHVARGLRKQLSQINNLIDEKTGQQTLF